MTEPEAAQPETGTAITAGHGSSVTVPEPGPEIESGRPGSFTAEGGHGAVPTTGVPATEGSVPKRALAPLWEVFVRSSRGLSHTHVGSLRAADAELALHHARDVYTRRQEGVSIWVVPAAGITASSPDEKDAFFDPAGDKPYRHPTFYDVPDGLTHL